MQSALVVRSACLGDVLSVEPTIRALRQTGYAVGVEAGIYQPVFKNNPHVTPIEQLDTPYKIFDLTGVYESQLHVLREAAYLKYCNVDLPASEKMPRLYLTDEEVAWGRSVLRKGKWAVLDPGYPIKASMTGLLHGEEILWQRAFWPLHHWNRLCELLSERGIKTVQIGNENTPFVSAATLDLRHKTNLRQLFAIIHTCQYFVGMESGPMHIAQALGLPGVAIFHPIHPVESLKPVGSKITHIYRAPGDALNHAEILNVIDRLEHM